MSVLAVNDPPACLQAGETDASDQSRSIIASPVATEAPAGPPGASINTTRSNIKRPGVAAEETEAPAGPPGAPINTTRSNIRKPGVAVEAPAGPPGAPVNTSRSNKKAGVAVVCEAGALVGVSTTR